jgi:hypothetical protein
MERRVLACGSRNWKDRELLDIVLGDWLPLALPFEHPDDVLVIHGGQTSSDDYSRWGADFLWGEAAKDLGYFVEPHPVDWRQARRRYGSGFKEAAFDRNFAMANVQPPPELVLAAHDDPELGTGTRHMVEVSMAKRFPVVLFRHRPDADPERVLLNDRAREMFGEVPWEPWGNLASR